MVISFNNDFQLLTKLQEVLESPLIKLQQVVAWPLIKLQEVLASQASALTLLCCIIYQV